MATSCRQVRYRHVHIANSSYEHHSKTKSKLIKTPYIYNLNTLKMLRPIPFTTYSITHYLYSKAIKALPVVTTVCLFCLFTLFTRGALTVLATEPYKHLLFITNEATKLQTIEYSVTAIAGKDMLASSFHLRQSLQ